MPEKPQTNQQRKKTAQLAGLPVSEVVQAEDGEFQKRIIPRDYNPAAQKKFCDKLLQHMEGIIHNQRDTMSIQQLSNSAVQVMRYRHELEDRERGAQATDADGNEQMDSSAQRARNKMLDFGERASG